MLRRFAAVAAVAALAALWSATLAHAQGALAQGIWPERPIRFIVHVAAGGGVDLNARILADRLNQQLPQRVLIENMGGAGGAIAARAVAKADPDGYTFLFAGPGHAAVPFMHKQPPYDPIKDFVPVTLVTKFPLVMVINPNVPAKNLTEFIALAKAEPGKHTFGSSGVGGSSHIPAEMFTKRAGVQMTHVPFRGNGPSSAALLGGQIDMIIDGLAPQLGNIAEGRVRVLGVTTKERTPFLPEVPAMSEVLPDYQFPMWVALFAPAKTPKAIVDRLAAEVGKAMQDPVTRKRYADVKVDPVGSNPEEFDAFFREQLKFNEDIIKSANIQSE
jgi:tripartite-type tricarboxylate transporter receptor subunit TctC